jgi:hypothetical protein
MEWRLETGDVCGTVHPTKTEAVCSTMKLHSGQWFKLLVSHHLLQRFRMDGDESGANRVLQRKRTKIGVQYANSATIHTLHIRGSDMMISNLNSESSA